MDDLKFYEITHRAHVICNPISKEKLNRLVDLLHLPKNSQAVDIACGKGEFLIRLAEVYGANGRGIDISPFYIDHAKRSLKTRLSNAGITFTQMSGTDFKPDKPFSLDLASCIGASWIFGGHAKTLDTLHSMVKPGGWVIVGEPFWQEEPSMDYLEAIGCARDDFGSHYSNAMAGKSLGLDLVQTIVSSKDDWDRYEGLQWLSTADFARIHPEDPDLKGLVDRVNNQKAAYLRWGRETLGWAIYLFRSRSTA
jgi:ubiquinone/menaquinone biosynthesis C-methylase UbiE